MTGLDAWVEELATQIEYEHVAGNQRMPSKSMSQKEHMHGLSEPLSR